MYFHTQTGKKDISTFATIATFFIDKFPQAFGASATYTNSKGVTSEEAYVRIDVASSVEYDFEEGQTQHAESFAKFQNQVLNSFKQSSESESAIFLLDLLLEMKQKIMELPTSIRQAECTVQRFFLLLWPLFNLAEAGDYARAKNLTERFISLLCDESDFSLKIKVDCLIQLYNSVHTNTGIKASAFVRLVQICHQVNSFDIIVQRAKSIVKDAENWSLTVDERRQLFRCVAIVLDQEGYSSSAFHVMFSCLKLYEATDSLAGTENDARRCVILAMKAVDVINFAELVTLPVVKNLTQTHAKVFSLLNLFTSSTAQEFKQKMAEFADLMTTEGLTENELIVKKSYVIVCSFDTSKTNHSYTELSEKLNIDKDEIEMWAIDAIQNNIIDAKIDQLNEMIVIKNHMLREIKLKEWQAIQQKIRAWKERFQRIKTVLAATNQATANVPATIAAV